MYHRQKLRSERRFGELPVQSSDRMWGDLQVANDRCGWTAEDGKQDDEVDKAGKGEGGPMS